MYPVVGPESVLAAAKLFTTMYAPLPPPTMNGISALNLPECGWYVSVSTVTEAAAAHGESARG